jgi:hypothetical protein
MNDYEDYILGGAGYIPNLKETINPITQKPNSKDYVSEEYCRLVEEQGYISQLSRVV